MICHSAGMSVGELYAHCATYDRLADYHWLKERFQFSKKLKFSLFDNAEHYISIYKRRTIEIKLFFERAAGAENRFFHGELYDKEVFKKIAAFLNIDDVKEAESHIHRSLVTPEEVLECQLKGQQSSWKSSRVIHDNRKQDK
jgi:hypothetical protein